MLCVSGYSHGGRDREWQEGMSELLENWPNCVEEDFKKFVEIHLFWYKNVLKSIHSFS